MFSIKKGTVIQYGFAIIVSLGAWASGAWLTWPSSAIKKLLNGEACCNVTDSEIYTMVALMDFGNILSPIPASYLCDAYGRKAILHSTAVIFVLSSVCVMWGHNVWYLYLGRLLAGLGKGICFAVTPLYLAEIAEVKIRGVLGIIMAQAAVLGMSYDYTLGAYLSYQNLNIANLVVPLVLGIGVFFAPETPYYLAMRGKLEKAHKSLATLRHLPINHENLKSEMEMIEESVEKDLKNKGRFIDVISTTSRRRALLIVLLASAAQRLCGVSPLLAFSTKFLPETGGGASREVYVMIMSYIMIVTTYIGQVLVDSWGRKNLLILSTFGCAAVDTVFAIFYTIRGLGVDVTHLNWIPYVCLLLFSFLWAVGLMLIPTILQSELFPTNVKSYASSIGTIVLGIVSFTINKMFGEVSAKYGVEVMFFFFTISSTLCGMCFICILFETKGKTFQEIQNKLHQITGDNEVKSIQSINFTNREY